MADTPWVLELKGENFTQPLKFLLDDKLILGRVDAKQEAQPDIDLGPYKADLSGVSRQHLLLHTEGDQLLVTDLNSGNGTLLNNVRLEPNKAYVVKHNDHLQLGRLHVEIGVVISPTQGSILQKDTSVRLDTPAPQGKGQLVLIVEDEVEVAKVLALILERVNFRTHITHDVVSAMRAFNQTRPAAILLDVMLPDMNGLELCRYVRRSSRRNSVPVIVVSAVDTAERIKQAIEAGADIFLGKPVSARELRHVVAALIEQYSSGQTTLETKHLAGTAPLQAMPPESRRDSVVLFVAGHSEQPITLTLRQPVVFGRAGGGQDKHYIDLSRYNAIDHGVSRRHMILHNRDGKFFVEDVESVNGTFLNGDPLDPHELRPINNADEIRLGQLRMYIYFLTDVDSDPFEARTDSSGRS
jgi:DNA-binding response OmpR family regulator/pSer/pThr/pTyr-binding forkhead associated (FHA) protein